MKNTKAFFPIILGSFIIATGFAFAETVNVSYEQLKDANSRGTPMGDLVQAAPEGTNTNAPAVVITPTPAISLGVVPPTPAPTPAPAKPGLGETIKKLWTDNARNILLGGIGAYLGFALFGPAGLIIGALVFVALGMV